MLAPDAVETITRMAREEGVEAASLLAIIQIESGGRVHAMIDGRAEPLIRFEGHYFDRRLSGSMRERARLAGLSSPKAGGIANPASQAGRWALLRQAAALAPDAAYESVSWGVGQVMGAHWRMLGYDNVAALVEEARSGLAGQARLMLRYLEKTGLRDALERHDWAAVARGYNGPAYAANGYDRKLARAYRSYAAAGGDAAGDRLAIGMRGEAVRELQLLLSAQGYPLELDGIFGVRTAEAVERFQRERGLAVSGETDGATMAALRARVPLDGLAGFLWRWAAGILRRFRI